MVTSDTRYEVVEKGKLLYRSPAATEFESYADCITWLANYNRQKPDNRAMIFISPFQQLSLF